MRFSCTVTCARLRLASLLLVTGALAGCSSDEPNPKADSPASSTAATPSATTSPSPTDALPCVPGVEPFTGPAADQFGPDAVMAAYCGVAELSRETAFTSLLVPGPHRAKDFDLVRPWLSSAGRRRWDDAVRGTLATGEPKAEAIVDALTLHDVRRVPAGYALADDPPAAFGTAVGSAEATVRGPGLELVLEVSTGIVLERRGDENGSHSLWPWTKRLVVTLVPSDDQWLLDRWRATWSRGQVRLASGG